MSNSDFMDLIIELQQQAQQDKIPITHSLLSRIGLRLHMPVSRLPEFVPVSHDDFMKEPPESWWLAMLELNWDIYDSSKALVLGLVSMSKVKTEETRQMWMTTLGGQGIDGAAGKVVDLAASPQTRALENCASATSH